MMKKLRTQRDNQQWMLDLALNLRGRVQNFERDDVEVPVGKRARNYRMLPKVWRQAAQRHEALAKNAQAHGANAIATSHYEHVVEAYHMGQHPIFFDDHPVKDSSLQQAERGHRARLALSGGADVTVGGSAR
jgi:hypothetical protein